MGLSWRRFGALATGREPAVGPFRRILEKFE
jgi:hypothetical protein